ncbi:MAG: endonuclease/exonuclease/phosphatase family protein [Planctomycetota bacterium]
MSAPLRLSYFLALSVAAACSSPGHSPSSSRGGATPVPSDGLRIVTYNIKHGLGMDGALDLERIAGVLEPLDADVVLLQEVDERCERSGGIDQAAWLGERLGMTPRFAPFMDYDGGRYGLATLSRLPVAASEVVVLPPGEREPRAALLVAVELQGRSVTVANAHLDWLADDARRLAQAGTLAGSLAAALRNGPVVLGGDLNDVPESPTLRLLASDAESGGAGLRRIGPDESTFSSEQPERTIDHFLVGPSSGVWTVSGVRVVDERVASDHRPVVADLAFALGSP